MSVATAVTLVTSHLSSDQQQPEEAMFGRKKSTSKPLEKMEPTLEAPPEQPPQGRLTCYSRFCREFRMSFFDEIDSNHKKLDLPATFNVQSTKMVFLGKFIFLALTLLVLIWDWVTSPYPSFYLAYLTVWTTIYVTFYAALSFLHSWCSPDSCMNSKSIMNVTWALYSLAVVHELIVILIYWVSVYDPSTTTNDFNNIMLHGGLYFLVLLDGLVVNRTPIRLKHYVFNLIMGLLYALWTVLHAFVMGENPNAPEDADDDTIYAIINWTNDAGAAAVLVVVLAFGALPICQLMFWAFSLCGRRYLTLDGNHTDDGDENENHDDDVEECIVPVGAKGSSAEEEETMEPGDMEVVSASGVPPVASVY